MRIATWNLARPVSGARRGRLLAWINRVEADIWVLTETHRQVAPSGMPAVAESTESARPTDDDQRWVAIHSRFPVLAIEPTTDPMRSCCVRVQAPRFGPVIIYGTVLPWLTDTRLHPVRGADAFVRQLDSQKRDWFDLRTKQPDHAFCVLGDFNQDLSDRHYYGSRIGRSALREALSEIGLTCLTCAQDDPVSMATGGTRACIDHICVDHDLAKRCCSVEAWPLPAELAALSDHFGTLASW